MSRAPVSPRYGRHVMLPEVGVAGQARLERAQVRLEGAARAREVAKEYLARAGVAVTEDGAAAPRITVDPGREELREVADFLAGAWTAVEAIKATLDVGRPARPLEHALTGPEER